MAFALTAPACLPFELSPAETPDAAANYPPEIVDASVSPRSSLIDLRRDADFQCSVDLIVGVVKDHDLEDELEARWFVDYDFSEDASNPLWWGQGLRNEGKVGRVGPSWTFNVDGPYATPGVHTVEVVISETSNFKDKQSRRLEDDASAVSYRWVIDVPAAARDYCRGAR